MKDGTQNGEMTTDKLSGGCAMCQGSPGKKKTNKIAVKMSREGSLCDNTDVPVACER